MLVVMVCTGNICRSPMAEGICRAHLVALGAPEVAVCSMGTMGLVDRSASSFAVEVCHEHGIDISRHRSKGLDAAVLANASHVFAMELVHREHVAEVCVSAVSRTWMLGAWPREPELLSDTVPDPIGRPLGVYRETFAILERHIARIAPHIADQSRRCQPESTNKV